MLRKLPKIGRLSTGRVGRMGVGTISRICCRPRFFARFQFGDRTRRSVRRRQAEAREELTSPVCRYKDANPSGPRIDQGHVKGICVLSRYRPTTVLIYEKWHTVIPSLLFRCKRLLRYNQVFKNFRSLAPMTGHCVPWSSPPIDLAFAEKRFRFLQTMSFVNLYSSPL